MDPYRSTYVEHSNLLSTSSDISGADLVVEKPLIRPVDSRSRSHMVYHDQERSSRNTSLQSQISPYSQGVTSHPAELEYSSNFLQQPRGGRDIELGSDLAQSQGASSVRQGVARDELPRSITTAPAPIGRPTMRLVTSIGKGRILWLI
jgi:hypothetical protein